MPLNTNNYDKGEVIGMFSIDAGMDEVITDENKSTVKCTFMEARSTLYDRVNSAVQCGKDRVFGKMLGNCLSIKNTENESPPHTVLRNKFQMIKGKELKAS